MTNLSGNRPTSEFNNRAPPSARSGAWMTPLAVVAAVAVLGLGYGYSNGWMNFGNTDHRLSTTDAPSAVVPSKP